MIDSLWLIDIALAVGCAEWLFVALRRRPAGTRREKLMLLSNVGAGLCLMLAVRAALTNASWPWIAACLAAAGAAHVADGMLRRAQSAGVEPMATAPRRRS